MATNNIEIVLNMNDNGSVRRVTLAVTELNKELTRAAELSERTLRAITSAQRASGGAAGGNGSSNTQNGAAGTGGSNAGNTGSAGNIYGQARAGVGTGAEARDFARQAEGLGGLVRVYATFAANIFAASTAFNALSKAMDTANMVKGLDQIGAASGRNLGNLTKQLVAASDGALSFKDALTATAQGSAGNLNSTQLLRLTAIAKNASQALGRDMPDALSRLTRGVTKIEPELLDELGILVKVEEASVNYARTIGKTASALTDIEKRQAFTNAVLLQGEKKFSDINIEANAYAKILASASNVATSALNGINTVLGPIIKLLSESPTALSAVIAGLATMLIRQAIPALGKWREGLAETARMSAVTSAQTAANFKRFQEASVNALTQGYAVRLRAEQTALEQAQKLAARAAAVGSAPNSKLVAATGKLATDLTPKDIRTIEKGIQVRATLAAQGGANATSLGNQARALQIYRNQIEATRVAETSYAAEKIRAEREITRLSNIRFSEANMHQMRADRQLRAASKAEVLSNVGTNTQTMGVRGAYAALKEDIKSTRAATEAVGRLGDANYRAAESAKAPLTGVTRMATMLQGTFAIATSAVSTFLGAIGPWIQIITLAVIGFGLLMEKMSDNRKETKEFNASIDTLKSGTETLGRTIDAINKKPFLEQFTIASMRSKINAVAELTIAVGQTVESLNRVDKKAGGFDKFIDGWKTLWGGDLKSTASKSIADAISEGLDSAADGPARAKFIKDLSSMGITDTSSGGIIDALDKVDKANIVDKMTAIKNSFEEFSKAAIKSSDNLVSFANGLDDSSKLADSLLLSFIPSDNLTKFGQSLINNSNNIARIIQDGPIDSILALKEVLGDANKLRLFPPEVISSLLAVKTDVDSTAAEITDLSKALITYRDLLEKVKDARGKAAGTKVTQQMVNVEDTRVAAGFRDDKRKASMLLGLQQTAIEESIGTLEKAQQSAREKEAALFATLNDAQLKTFDAGADLIKIALKNASETAALSIAKAVSGGLSGRGSADVQYKLQIREIELEETGLKASMELIKANYESKLAIEKLTAINQKTLLAREKETILANPATAKSSESTARITEIDKLTKNVDITIRSLETVTNAIKSNVGKSLMPVARGLEDPNARSEVLAYASSTSGIAAQLEGTSAQKTIAANEKKLKQAKDEMQYKIDLNEQTIKGLGIKEQELEVMNKFGLITDDVYVSSKASIDLQTKSLNIANTILEKENFIADQKLRGVIVGTQIKNVEDQINLLNKEKVSNARELSIIEDTRIKQLQEQARLRNEALASAKITADLGINLISEEDASLATYKQELEKLTSLRDRQMETANKSAVDTAKSEGKSTEGVGASSEVAAAIEKQLSDSKQLLDLNRLITVEREKQASILRDQAEEMDELNNLTKATDSIAKNLSGAFGDFGDAIGGILTSASKQAKDRLKIDQDLKNKMLKNDKDYGKNSKKANDLNTKAEKEAVKDRTRNELDGYSEMLGAAKNFFGEKTAAAQLFGAAEKAVHIVSMALEAEALVTKGAALAQTIAMNMTEMGSNVAVGVSKIWSQLGVFGPIGIAVLLASMAAFGFGGGGGGGGGAIPSAEQLQKSAGTGQRYNSKGELVETGTGVLGDSSARSESISKSLDLLQEYTYENIEYSNKMLNALLAIRDSIGNLATSIYKQTGLTGGYAATSKTDSASKGFLGFSSSKTELKDTGIQIAKQTVGDIIANGIAAYQYQIIETTKKKYWGLSKSSSTREELMALDSDIKNNLTLSIKSVTQAVLAAADQLGMGGQSVVDKINGLVLDLDNISLKDMKPTEISAYLEGVLGSIGDSITTTALGSLKHFQQAGEALLETAVRVARSSQIFDLQFQQLGVTVVDASKNSLEAKLALIELSGGLETFTEQSTYFRDNFLNEAERLAPVQKAVSAEMSRLNLSSVDTVEEFKKLVLSYGEVGGITSETYVALMNVSKGFSEVYGTADDLADKVKELADAQSDIVMGIATSLASLASLDNASTLAASEKLLRLERARELKDLDKSLIALKEYEYALEDEVTARDALVDSYKNQSDELQNTIDKLTTSSKSLRDFRNSLFIADSSTLTNSQKYTESKKQFDALLGLISGPNATTDETVREDALNKLQSASTAFLTASSTYNASSDQYSSDFARVTAALASTADALDNKKSDSELQLEAMKDSVKNLINIDESVISVKDAIDRLTEATLKSYQASIAASMPAAATNMGSLDNLLPGLASGGVGRGVTVVGENGPEIVNFDGAGRVFDNNQSQGMMGGMIAPLLEQIKVLTEKVDTLTKESSANAALLVKATQLASKANAEDISGTLEKVEELAARRTKLEKKPK